ncbi:unnamed protein product [Caenorhabditis brenneri]
MTSEQIYDLIAKYSWQREPYLAIPYPAFNTCLRDITEEGLNKISEEVVHLSEAVFPSPPFPVKGILWNPNLRLMVPLVFRETNKPNAKALNVWCVFDTTCLHTFLSVKTIKALVGEEETVEDGYYLFDIQVPNNGVTCCVSRVGSEFEHANIIGMDAIRHLRVSPVFNLFQGTFSLVDAKNNE